jgi:hypothetical protein
MRLGFNRSVTVPFTLTARVINCSLSTPLKVGVVFHPGHKPDVLDHPHGELQVSV